MDSMTLKRLKVLLISPWSYPPSVSKDHTKVLEYRLYPFSIVYLVNYIKKLDLCEIDYMDLVMASLDDYLSRIQSEKFDLIGFTSTTEARFSTIDLIRQTRKLSPHSQIVVGGMFFGPKRQECLHQVSEVDYVVYGEGEKTLAELIQFLSQKNISLSAIDGLCFRNENGQIQENQPRKEEQELDQFKIDYDLIHKEGYDLLFPLKNYENEGYMAFPLMLGRGCNQKCIFCVHRLHKYRVRKLSSIMEDIDWAIDKLKARYFMFTEPSFCERRKFVEEFCNHLIQNNYQIKWYCEGRVDTPIELLKLMAKAGCISMDYALESGSDSVLKTLGKRTKINEVHHFAQSCRDLGIRSYVFSMYSLPDETYEDLLLTEEIVKNLCENGIGSDPCGLLIYPGTPLEKLAHLKGVLSPEFDWYDPNFRTQLKHAQPRAMTVPHYQEHLTDEQITAFLQRCKKYDRIRREKLGMTESRTHEGDHLTEWYYQHARYE